MNAQRTWRDALDYHANAVSLIDNLLGNVASITVRRGLREDLNASWRVDQELLKCSKPFFWSAEVTDAVMHAGRSIPLDARLNKWNLNTPAAWWFFERSLPLQTVTSANAHVCALNFGWLRTNDPSFGLPCVTWIDEEIGHGHHASPSQTWEWPADATLGEMLEQTRAHHRRLYGPNGRWHGKPTVGPKFKRLAQPVFRPDIVGEDVFMETTEVVARFVLAGLAWINQKVIVVQEERAERHARKRLERATGQSHLGVQVVQLRRVERKASEPADGEDKREYSCRWVVDGHWRNQACGTGMTDHRLTFIHPYVKGPDDKELRVSPKVYVVNR